MEKDSMGRFVKEHNVSEKSIEALIKNNHKSKRFLGGKHTEEAKKKIGEASKGNKYAKGNKPNKTSFKKGHKPWCTGKKLSEEHIKKLSISHKGKPTWSNGLTAEDDKRIRSKDRHHNWKGGITPLHNSIRLSRKYKEWVKFCLNRDKKCKECGVEEGLIVHHIKFLSKIFEEIEIKNFKQAMDCSELWEVKNGIVLCRACHNKLHKIISQIIIEDFRI